MSITSVSSRACTHTCAWTHACAHAHTHTHTGSFKQSILTSF